MNDIFNTMLKDYDQSTAQARRNAIFEVNQQIILSGLHSGGFFDEAAFYGGTCLRIFHGLQRFSEDLDFSLISPNESFDFTRFFPAIVNEFNLVGRSVEISRKEKRGFGKVESAFLKDNTEVYNVSFQTEKSIKIKIEVDVCPSLKFETENRLLLQPKSFFTKCFTLPCLFAGKMLALMFRNWKNRVKGRDWFDFEWYVRHGVPLDFTHLQERILQFNGEVIDKETFYNLLRERFSAANISQVKADVIPFVHNTHDLDIWSNDYFMQLVDHISFSS